MPQKITKGNQKESINFLKRIDLIWSSLLQIIVSSKNNGIKS